MTAYRVVKGFSHGQTLMLGVRLNCDGRHPSERCDYRSGGQITTPVLLVPKFCSVCALRPSLPSVARHARIGLDERARLYETAATIYRYIPNIHSVSPGTTPTVGLVVACHASTTGLLLVPC